MATAQVQQLAGMLAALSQATRLRIIEIAAAAGEEGLPAGDIAREVNCPASTLSFHLKELSQVGLLSPAPQGRFIRYSVQPAAFAELSQFVASLPGRCRPAAPAAREPRGRERKGGRKDEASSKTGTDGQMSIFGD